MLTTLSGGARLKDPTFAPIIVKENDYPVTLSPPVLYIQEGKTGYLNVSISKSILQKVNVSIISITNTALLDDFVAMNERVIFYPGEIVKTIAIKTIDDNIPELIEKFTVSIYSTTGDTVLFQNYSSEIFIMANDNPYGLLEFNESYTILVSEGQLVNLRFV